jgi:hypothetical protein
MPKLTIENSMKKNKLIFVILFFLVLITKVLAEIPNLNEMEKGALLRVRNYDGLEFFISSSLYQEKSNGEKIDSLPDIRETIRLHFPEKGPAWKYWKQEVQDKFDQQWIVNRFKVTNVSETRNFRYTPEGEGKWNDANIIPWYQWDETTGRHFFTFLGMGVSCFSFFDIDESQDIRKMTLENLKNYKTRKGICDGIETVIFYNRDEKNKIESEIHITIPHFLVVRVSVHMIGEKYSRVYNVEKIGFFEGICYPQKGSIHETALREIDRLDHKFEVINVHRFDENLLKNWFPEWPPSTIVVDVKTDKNITIPPSERQLKKVAEEWNTQVEQAKYSYWNVVRIIFIIVGILFIITGLFLAIRKRYKP